MPTLFKQRLAKVGRPPGTLVHVGEKRVAEVTINIIDYNEKRVQVSEAEKIEDCFPYLNTETVTWININGLHQIEVIEKIGAHFGLHPLLLEDIISTQQRPKVEDFDDRLFIVAKMFYYNGDEKDLRIEQISLVLGPSFVISFQESEGDVFDPIRERIRNGKGRIRKMGPDYLAYALLDAIVDNYFVIMERIGERIEDLGEELVTSPKSNMLQDIHNLKRELIFLRKSVWPLREVIGTLERGESSLIQQSTAIYLKDVYDHTIQVIDTVETFRDMVAGMLDVYLSSVSNRMNEVMKVLTVIATIFIPLTFIAGVYGMNFRYMPELEWRWGYFAVLGGMILVVIAMALYFRNKKWI